MRPGYLQEIDNDRAYVTPGEITTDEGIFLSAGGYWGVHNDKHYSRQFYRAVQKAIKTIEGYPYSTHSARQEANRLKRWLAAGGRTILN